MSARRVGDQSRASFFLYGMIARIWEGTMSVAGMIIFVVFIAAGFFAGTTIQKKFGWPFRK